MPRQAAFLKLTNFQKLKTDPTPVLRIRIRDLQDKPVPPEQTLYIRGAVLDTYEKGEWRTDFKKYQRRDGDDGRVDGWTELERNIPAGRKIVRQEIQTVALSEDLSFALADPIRVEWKDAKYDPSGVLFFPVPPRGVVKYQVESALMPAQLPSTPPQVTIPEKYLQLPPGLDLLRIHEAFQDRAGHDPDGPLPDKSFKDRAEQHENNLPKGKTRFSFQLSKLSQTLEGMPASG